MFEAIFYAILRLFFITIVSFIVFRIPVIQYYFLSRIVFLSVNVFLPLYFIYNFSIGWSEVTSIGYLWIPFFFFGSITFFGIQFILGTALVRKSPLFATHMKKELISFFSTQNAGYLPLPIMAVFAPPALMVYMFFWILGFNIILWSFTVSYLTGTGKKLSSFRPNAPLIGLISGIIIAVFNLLEFLPPAGMQILQFSSKAALNLIMISLGGILAAIPRKELGLRKEFIALIGVKMIAYPLFILFLLFLVPLTNLPPQLALGLKLGLVIQAAVPPATNIMLIAKKFGTQDQVHYTGNAIITTYIAALFTLPAILFISLALFSL